MKPQTQIHVDCFWAVLYGAILSSVIIDHNGAACLGFSILFIGKIFDGIESYLNYKNRK